MVGRTHGIHAEPVTLGLKFCMYAFEMKRNLERLEDAREKISSRQDLWSSRDICKLRPGA